MRMWMLLQCLLYVFLHFGLTQTKGSRAALENSILKQLDTNYKLQKSIPKVVEVIYEPANFEATYYAMYTNATSSAIGSEKREGFPTESNSCDDVREVPDTLRHFLVMRPIGISLFYQKYTEAYGIPVIGSGDVADEALQRACYALRYLLSQRADLRYQYYKHYGRVAVLGQGELIHQLPDYDFLRLYMNATRALGAVPVAPVTVIGEENLLCKYADPHRKEDLSVRAITMGIYHLAARYVDPVFTARLTATYQMAIEHWKWENTYAALSADAYLGKGAQSFFNVNGYSSRPNGIHNFVNTRAKLKQYDIMLYYLLKQLYPCHDFKPYIKRCTRRGNEFYQVLPMPCAAY